ncbi:MAG: hypothetical protein CTY16_00960 [Methylobacter sp.]|nr:MAG: hypothetical protein CTY16_00960 [Methylobacter sp.]
MKNEFCFDDVIGRLKNVLNISNDYELAERLDMKPTTFNGRKKANSLPFADILRLANSENLDFNWVLTGKGDMFRTMSETIDRGLDSEKITSMLEGLNEDQKLEVLSVIKEKMRLNELEALIKQTLKQ